MKFSVDAEVSSTPQDSEIQPVTERERPRPVSAVARGLGCHFRQHLLPLLIALSPAVAVAQDFLIVWTNYKLVTDSTLPFGDKEQKGQGKSWQAPGFGSDKSTIRLSERQGTAPVVVTLDSGIYLPTGKDTASIMPPLSSLMGYSTHRQHMPYNL